MLEGKLQKKYDFFTFNSELKIPPENISSEDQSKDMIQNSSVIIEEELNQYNNQFKIENSTFIIKEHNKLILIFSVDKDLPSKIEKKKNTYSISLPSPVLQAISFRHKSKDESIIISAGDSIDDIKVFQFELKKLMHEESFILLNKIENSLKIIPIKNSLALVLHYSTQNYKNGGLKLWKNFEEEIYNFKKVYNFTFNFQYNKLICVDNKEAPFIFSVYSFEESYFIKNKNESLEPDFFISLVENTKNIKEEEIELFLHFESFSNIIFFWAKTKNESSGYVFTIIFVDFNNKKCSEFVEIIFKAKNKYLFKKNEITDEIYIFNLTEELLFIFSFKEKDIKSGRFTSEDLLFTKIHFCGNIKGIDFTGNNGLVVLTEQNNLVCYSRNENLFNSSQKEYNINSINKNDEESNDSINKNINGNLNNSLNEDDLNSLNNNLKKIFNKNEKIEGNFLDNNLDLNKGKKNNSSIIIGKIEPTNLFNKNKIKSNDNEVTNKNNIIKMNLDSSKTPKDIEKVKNLNIEEKFCQTNRIFDEDEEEDELSEDKKNNNDENQSIKEEKDVNEDDKKDESKNMKEEKDENEDDKKKLLEIEKELLEKKCKSYLKQKEIIEKFKTTNLYKNILNKTIELFKNNITKLENEILKDITKFKPKEKYDEIMSNISILNEKKKPDLKYDYDKIDIELTKAKHYILQIHLFIIDINRIKNKIMEITKKNNENKNLKKNKDNNNCDYESAELIDNCMNIEFKDKKEIKAKIENLLYDCNINDTKINNIFEMNSLSLSIDNKLKILLNKCRNDIDKICELYKYNKFSQKEENEFICGIINPFINFFNSVIKDFESKINTVSKEIDMFNKHKNNKEERAHSFCNNKYLNELKKIVVVNSSNNGNLREIISNYLEEIYEENNFYTTKGIIIDYNCINMDDEFKDDK